MGAFLISEGILIKENENEKFGEKVAQEVFKTFCGNGSGKRKKLFYKNLMKYLPGCESANEE
jgi:hypothetical protein